MSHDIHPRIPRLPALIGALALTGALGLVTACGDPPHRGPASAGITPGAGQSLPGMPGGTGPASAIPVLPNTATAAPTRSAPVTPVGPNSVTIKNFAFHPAALTVKAGTTVTWINQDPEPHTVTSQGQGQGPLRSAALASGARYLYKFTKPGTYKYLCSIHPFMTATVTVTQ
ncbi:plastocyanin/azurin family copper-binding protein [Streptosporangium sp. NPDC001681]|uniref:cupredoxin domain-containing protein n=1 Tax=Streptosporangium sp. NPDC001681 TaxID=3154395 RepID=UPI00332CF711